MFSLCRTLDSLYEELVTEGIIQRTQKVTLQDFVGEFSFLGTTLRQANIEPMPSLSDVRRLVTEFVILPLGKCYTVKVGPNRPKIQAQDLKTVRVQEGGVGN